MRDRYFDWDYEDHRRDPYDRDFYTRRDPGPGTYRRDIYSRNYYGPDYYGRKYDYDYGSYPGRVTPGPYAGRGPRGYRRSDRRIEEDVNDHLTWHGELDASDIQVEIQDGVVTLTGTVRDRRAKRLAEDISDSIPGVQDVHNRLQLQSGRGTPERWTDEVGQSGVYPASEAQNAPKDAEAQGMASWGQGERGAEGYYDHGESELHLGKGDNDEI